MKMFADNSGLLLEAKFVDFCALGEACCLRLYSSFASEKNPIIVFDT